MSQTADEEGFAEDKYQKIVTLLSAHKQGRDFLDQFVDGGGGLNDNILSSGVFDQGQSLLSRALQEVERLEQRQEEAEIKVQQISQSVTVTVEQMRGSGENLVVVRVLDDVVAQLEHLDQSQIAQQALSAQILEHLEEVQQHFSHIVGSKKDEQERVSIDQTVADQTKNKSFF